MFFCFDITSDQLSRLKGPGLTTNLGSCWSGINDNNIQKYYSGGHFRAGIKPMPTYLARNALHFMPGIITYTYTHTYIISIISRVDITLLNSLVHNYLMVSKILPYFLHMF